MVEPVDPFQCRVFDGFEGSPGPPPMHDLGLVEAIDGLGQGVVITVADTADRGLDAGLGEALCVFDRQVLGGFKWSSQHNLCSLTEAIGQAPLPAFSKQASFEAWS